MEICELLYQTHLVSDTQTWYGMSIGIEIFAKRGIIYHEFPSNISRIYFLNT